MPKFSIIIIPDQEKDAQYPDTSPSISFHVYHLIALCTKHDRILLTEKKLFHKCQQDTTSGQLAKIYTIKELVMMERNNSNVHTSFYIPEIQTLAFHIPHV